MSRRNRTTIFNEVIERLRQHQRIGRAELSRKLLTDPQLYKKIIDALEELGMIRRYYFFNSSGRQIEMLDAVDLDDNQLIIKALSKILAPSLRELLDLYWTKRHPTAEVQKTSEELEKEASAKRAFNLVRRSFHSERAKGED